MNTVGVFQWTDGKITAVAIRDDILDKIPARLACETFSYEGALDLANNWGTKTRFCTRNELNALTCSITVAYHQLLGKDVAKVMFFEDDDFYYYVCVVG